MSNLSKNNRVFFAFFIILATTLNFGFFIGDMNNLRHHHIFELFFAVVVSFIAFTLKLGTRTQLDTIQLATSTVSCLQLGVASGIWFFASNNNVLLEYLPSIVSLSGGAFLANLFSIILLIIDAVITKR
jgi:hypothetical protein